MEIFTVAETAASIVKIHPLAGNVTPVRHGRAYPTARLRPWSNTRSATAWASSALITSGHLVAASRIRPAALLIQAAAATDKSRNRIYVDCTPGSPSSLHFRGGVSAAAVGDAVCPDADPNG